MSSLTLVLVFLRSSGLDLGSAAMMLETLTMTPKKVAAEQCKSPPSA
jgi:hypothetical protein